MKYVIPLILALPAIGLADSDLVDVRDKSLDISCHQISEQNGAVQCSVQQPNLNLIDVFQIADPARLVMDLAERPKGVSHKKTARNTRTLAGVRTGWHPDKYRIVFDLNPDQKIKYTWRQDKNTVFLEVTPDGPTTIAAIASPEINVVRRLETEVEKPSEAIQTVKTTDIFPVEPAAAVAARSSVQSAESVTTAATTKLRKTDCTDPDSAACTPANSAPVEDASVVALNGVEGTDLVDTEKPTVVRPTELSKVAVVRNSIPAPENEAPILTQRQEIQAETIVESNAEEKPITAARARMNPTMLEKEKPALEGQVLHGISFSTSSDSENPVVHLKLTEKPHFNLSKLGPRTYRLRVLRCNIQDESLTLPFFPPHTFPRVSFLQAESGTDKVELTIGVERGTRLMAVSSDNGIDIKVIG
jgi:hypothetical protein